MSVVSLDAVSRKTLNPSFQEVRIMLLKDALIKARKKYGYPEIKYQEFRYIEGYATPLHIRKHVERSKKQQDQVRDPAAQQETCSEA